MYDETKQELYNHIRRYGVIEFDSEFSDESGFYREMRIAWWGSYYYVKMHNGNVITIK